MASNRRYDAIVVGSGQGGKPLAKAFAEAGRRTALIERTHVGGTCVNEGCTPTKTMVASARVAYLARRAEDYGVLAGPVSVDMTQVRERKRKMVDDFRRGDERGIARTKGLDLIMGEARFTGPRTLEVRLSGGELGELSADQIVINAGERPGRPPVPGLDRVAALDSTSVMELAAVPDHLLVLGGGYIGLEFGQMFRRFGSRVTIVQRGKQLLSREDPDVAEAVEKVLRQDGIELILEADAEQVAPAAGGGIELFVRSAGARRSAVVGSHLLVATGRVANTDTLNLEAAGVQVDQRGFISVNDRLETSVPGIYALGDITGGPAYTHISYDDFRILEANLLKGGSASTRGRLVPYTVFIDPELGRVGLSEVQARGQGRRIRVAKMPMSSVARALEVDEPRGLMKAVVDAESGQILGFAILGIWGGEIMSIVEVAMMGQLPYTALQNAVFAHPTLAESLNNLFDYLDA
jgi:pyruvate/2-oxoglutarate dehydrogenase complex dihydrolipoamide dehydrogenase (E3) component